MSWSVQKRCSLYAEEMRLVDFGLRVSENLIAGHHFGDALYYLAEVRRLIDHAEALARRELKGGAS